MSQSLAARSGQFKIGGEYEVNRLGFGAMRVTGPGIWGQPKDKKEAIAVLQRDAAALAVVGRDAGPDGVF